MIVCLLYLTVSRLDICFSVGDCARYHANPKESHFSIVQRIISHANDTIEFWDLVFKGH